MVKDCSFRLMSICTTVAFAMSNFQFASADVPERHHQLCWARGAYDRTIYFAEIADREDREQSFKDMIELFGIANAGIHCSFYAEQTFVRERSEIFETWKSLKLDVLNTTFLSDLDY